MLYLCFRNSILSLSIHTLTSQISIHLWLHLLLIDISITSVHDLDSLYLWSRLRSFPCLLNLCLWYFSIVFGDWSTFLLLCLILLLLLLRLAFISILWYCARVKVFIWSVICNYLIQTIIAVGSLNTMLRLMIWDLQLSWPLLLLFLVCIVVSIIAIRVCINWLSWSSPLWFCSCYLPATLFSWPGLFNFFILAWFCRLFLDWWLEHVFFRLLDWRLEHVCFFSSRYIVFA